MWTLMRTNCSAMYVGGSHCLCLALRIAIILLVSHLVSGLSLAAVNDPVAVEFSYCEPVPDLGFFGPGYSGDGYSQSPVNRHVRVYLAYHTVDVTDDVNKALAQTWRIEISCVTPGGAFGGPWTVFNRASGFGALPPASLVAQSAALSIPDFKHPVELALDWLADFDAFLILRVNGQPWGILDAVAQNGSCAVPRLMASYPEDGRIKVIATNPGTKLFGTFDVCMGGSHINWMKPYGVTPHSVDFCPTKEQADIVGRVVLGFDDAQFQRVQAQLKEEDREYAWRNGYGIKPDAEPFPASVGGQLGFLPTYVWLGPHESAGQSSPGAFYMNVTDIVKINSLHPDTIPPRVLALTAHEYFHQLQWAWGREHPNADPHINSTMLSEAMAASVQGNLCIEDLKIPGFPDLPAKCVSAGKLPGDAGTGIYTSANRFLENPGLDLLGEERNSCIVLLYAQQQFAHAVGSPAHPSGLASKIPRPSEDEGIPLRDRCSDEGIDILGLFFQMASFAGPGVSTTNVLDNTLRGALGRSLADVLFDLHTALFLKDYTDTDPRWRFDWTHGDGYMASTLLKDGKPFRVPSDLYGSTCSSCPPANPWCPKICDGLIRARRELDSYKPGGWGTAIRDLLPYGSIRSGTKDWMEPRAAACFSVSPDSLWWGKSMPIRVREHSGSGGISPFEMLPRFRVFRVDQVGKDLIPVPQGGQEPLFEIIPEVLPGGAKGFFESITEFLSGGAVKGFVVNVPITSATREVLLIASSRILPGRAFDWSFGSAVYSISSATGPGASEMASTMDADGDGLPWSWEIRNGLSDHDSSDAAADDDDDGLDASAEWRLGTSPLNDDSDGGGESDGSEVFAGRDPANARDDLASAPDLFIVPGNRRVKLEWGMNTCGLAIEVQRKLEGSDGFDPVESAYWPNASAGLDAGLINDSSYCYRARTHLPSGATSAWSRIVCAIPRVDPYAPDIEQTDDPIVTSDGVITIPLRLEETGDLKDAAAGNVDLGVVETRGAEIRYWFATEQPGNRWQPFVDNLRIDLPSNATSVRIQARDRAGNIGNVLVVPLSMVLSSEAQTSEQRKE